MIKKIQLLYLETNKKYLMRNVFLVDIVPIETPIDEINNRKLELENLVQTHGWIVILWEYQKRKIPDYKTFVGKGKLEELKHQMSMEWADLLIIWNKLKPQQIHNINESLREIKAECRDKVDLILKIFDKHAQSTEAKLQTELAAIKHMGPRIFGMWMELSRQWWGIGTRGKWETNIQIMKRHLRESEKKIKNKLKQYEKTRQLHRQWRKKKWLATVGIVGYTNAGKSSLLNAITNKWVQEEDKLFATLWTSVGSFYAMKEDKWKKVLVNDTIWFISDLPPELLDAFASTLEDSIQSDILIHLIDAWDKKLQEKIYLVDNILERIWANQPRLYVFNKKDTISSSSEENLKNELKDYNPFFISAQDKQWVQDLIEKIKEMIF